MKWLNKIWDWLSGKKRNIGIIAGLILKGINVFSNLLTPDQYNVLDGAIDVFLLGALTHAGAKSESVKNGLKIANEKVIKKTIESAKRITKK